ncbi:MAG: aldehyde dehydrogenase family protein [Saprospiraceae bacterium]|nr:aldehyde dehydrogenase family protein [Saprospiraceae bacterium]
MTTTAFATPTSVQASHDWATEINQVFEAQKANQYAVAATTASQRRAKLKKLLETVMKYRPQIQEAGYLDYKKSPEEVDLTEVYAMTTELKHTISNLQYWMNPKSVETPLTLFGTSSHIHYEPKGVVLIISPWNFPFNLTIGPLASAIAAGNCVMIKPSENTPHAAALIKKMLAEVFPENEVAVFEGDAAVAQYITKLPFNHIFFTGSPMLGKKVMAAAAENLCSVTLELGGKSPVIVDESANLKKAAKRLAWGKFTNNGQICIAPDYVYVQENVKEAFITEFKNALTEMYANAPEQSKDYNRIVNRNHFNRLNGYLTDAKANGATIEVGGEVDAAQNYIAPTLLTNVSMDSIVMKEEIFGPILPILTFKQLDEAIQHIQANEKPLALYIFSHNNKNIRHIINQTRAGATVVNHNTLHFSQQELPFGGSNNSGIGKGHGKFGFEEFSNARGILKQWSPFSTIDLLMPPYTGLKKKIIDLTIKYF